MLIASRQTISRKLILNAIKALADETRIRILNLLSFGALNVNEIVDVLEMGQSRISRHLKILSDASLVQSNREGTWVYYSLTEQASFSFDLKELILSYKEDLPNRESDQQKVSYLFKNREEKSSSYFDKVAKNYENLQKQVLNPEVYRKQIISYLPSKLNTILDLGCGTGELFPYLLKKSKSVLGIDSSSEMIREAKSNFSKNKNIKLIESPLETIPVQKNSADAVIASMVLHHISNPPLVLSEANRVLKENGTLCIVDLKKHDKEFMRDNFSDLWLGFELPLLKNWLSTNGFIFIESSEIKTSSDFTILTIKANKKGGLNVRSN